MDSYAILLDGGFVTKKLGEQLANPPRAADIITFVESIKQYENLNTYDLMRVYYYDAPPSDETLNKPVSGDRFELATTPRYRQAQSLYDQLELSPGFALRMGETRLAPDGWKLSNRCVKQLKREPRALTDADFKLDISQKGVDMRIGLDMARLALRDLVKAVVVVTGDSDFVPAFKFVRREGVKVMLCTMGHRSARRELKAHADFVIS